MPVKNTCDHVKLINDLLQYEDISNEILEHIDINEMDRIDRRKRENINSEHRRRWRRGKNSYDSLKFYEIRR
tara:strand:+ start:670 stop:885 length:216 start_codon:yes stop_codon:yes gene_type:complete